MKHFKYPATELPWRFDWPWQCDKGLKGWLFYNWTFHSNNRFTVGFRVLGFCKIYWIYTVKEEEARRQYTENMERGLAALEKMLTSNEN